MFFFIIHLYYSRQIVYNFIPKLFISHYFITCKMKSILLMRITVINLICKESCMCMFTEYFQNVTKDFFILFQNFPVHYYELYLCQTLGCNLHCLCGF